MGQGAWIGFLCESPIFPTSSTSCSLGYRTYLYYSSSQAWYTTNPAKERLQTSPGPYHPPWWQVSLDSPYPQPAQWFQPLKLKAQACLDLSAVWGCSGAVGTFSQFTLVFLRGRILYFLFLKRSKFTRGLDLQGLEGTLLWWEFGPNMYTELHICFE